MLLAGLAAGASIQLESGAFRVTGIAATAPAGGWDSVFSVYAGGADVPPMLGAYSVEGGALVFRPRFPLASGVKYRAVFRISGSAPLEAVFDGPKPVAAPATRVARVYPSGAVLPSNQLRLYVYFSAPMQRGGVWEHIKLLDESGKPLMLPFLEIDQELWNPDHTRLTILFDPGRIKRGVTPQQEMGPAIVEGKRYTLVIDGGLRDARGVPLRQAFRKEFRGTAAIRTAIGLQQWKITAPSAGSRAPLVVDFPRPLDYGLLEHVMSVKDVPGSVSIEAGETRWRFTPSQPWRAGDHTLVIDMALEDQAGNRIGRPFDVDIFNDVTERISKEITTLSFRVR
jgi:hypothetical protein